LSITKSSFNKIDRKKQNKTEKNGQTIYEKQKGGKKMNAKVTEKELLYIADALGHEKYLIEQCHTAASTLSDAELKAQAAEMEDKHRKLFSELYALL
jgi:hypothetical protein